MKKFLALVMAMAMTLSLVACGSAGTASSSPEAPASGSDLKVGAIYINSKNDTAGYTFAHHNGIVNGMKDLGLDPETQL